MQLAIALDDFALEALPGVERDLAHAGAIVMRSFRGLPNPNLFRQYRGAAVVGGRDRFGLLSRVETATATTAAPVIAILPAGVAPVPELRGPGVVDLIPAGSRGVAERILLMARVPVVSGRYTARASGAMGAARARPSGPVSNMAAPSPASPSPSRSPGISPQPATDPEGEFVAVASSTGGVWVLAALLRDLPARGRTVVVAQHMDGEFVPFFADWLQGATGWRTVLVSSPIPRAPETVYVPAGGLDLVVEHGTLRTLAPSSRYIPSGDRLLATAANAAGRNVVGVVLSGMGSDGAEGLAEVVRHGGRALCQDPATAAVPSMPESALRKALGALVAPPEALARAVERLSPANALSPASIVRY